MTERPRPWLDPTILGQEMREVLGVGSVDYRHMLLFLRALGSTLVHLEALAEGFPEDALRLYREFLVGIGDIADRVQADENDLAEFAEEVAESALAHVSRNPGAGLSRVPLLADLIRLRAGDRDEAFYFVPALIEGLGLGRDERVELEIEGSGG